MRELLAWNLFVIETVMSSLTAVLLAAVCASVIGSVESWKSMDPVQSHTFLQMSQCD